MLKPEELSSMYKRWCVLYHPYKQNDKLAEERREEATKVIKDFGTIIQDSEAAFIFDILKISSLIVALNILLVFKDLVFIVS